MISEKILASEFGAFWSECLPLLTPSFVRVFNEAYCEDLTQLPAKERLEFIPIDREVSKHDLLAEFAFCIAEMAYGSEISSQLASQDDSLMSAAYLKALGFLKRYDCENGEMILNEAEHSEAVKIASQYSRFFDYRSPNNVAFRPGVGGSGFLSSCVGDLSVDDTLYEVKTVKRNLAGKDVRQLILYLALQWSSGEPKWKRAGFFNPRRGLHYSFSVDHLIYRASGGRSVSEVFHDMSHLLSSRDIEVDSIF